MKKLLNYFLASSCIVFLAQQLAAQNKLELGAFGGVSYYLGNINPTRQFYSPSLAYGITFRYVLNNREAIRFQVNYAGLSASDRDFDNAYQQFRDISFSTNLVDMAVLYEFNFLPFQYKQRHHSFTPFLFAGIGYEVIINSTYNIPNQIDVPFGMGIKYLLNKRTTIGLEWSFRKTFQDQIDGIGNPGGNQYKSILNNNDWYSFAGFFISFRLFDNSICPVYK